MLVGFRERRLESQVRDSYGLVQFLVQTKFPLERHCLYNQLRALRVRCYNVAAIRRHKRLPCDVQVGTNHCVRHAVDKELGWGLLVALALALDEVEATQMCVGHADWYAAVVLQADGLDTVESLQVNLVYRGFIFEEYKGKPKSTKIREKVNSLSTFG